MDIEVRESINIQPDVRCSMGDSDMVETDLL